jgi:hypothetical protein
MSQCGICWYSLCDITTSNIRPVACENSKCSVWYCSGCIQQWFSKQIPEHRVCPNCTGSLLVPVPSSSSRNRAEPKQLPRLQMGPLVILVFLLWINLPLSALINYILITESLPLFLYNARNAIIIGLFLVVSLLYTMMYLFFCAPLCFITTICITHYWQRCISTLMGLLRLLFIVNLIADRELRLLLMGIAAVNYMSECLLIH